MGAALEVHKQVMSKNGYDTLGALEYGLVHTDSTHKRFISLVKKPVAHADQTGGLYHLINHFSAPLRIPDTRQFDERQFKVFQIIAKHHLKVTSTFELPLHSCLTFNESMPQTNQ